MPAIPTSRRPLTDKERKAWGPPKTAFRRRAEQGGCCCIPALILAMLVLGPLVGRHYGVEARYIWLPLAVIMLTYVVSIRLLPSSADLDADLRDDEAVVYRLALTRVLELGDEGQTFVGELAPNQVLVLSGQWLDEHTSKGHFPCTDFELSVLPRSQRLLSFQMHGAYLQPTKRNAVITDKAILALFDRNDQFFFLDESFDRFNDAATEQPSVIES